MVRICRLLAQRLRQPLKDRSAIVERHDLMQVILQDAEMHWMQQDEHPRRIPDLQAIGKKLGRSRLAYMTAVGVVDIT
jgi:DNA mismatch repair ATPase MutS